MGSDSRLPSAVLIALGLSGCDGCDPTHLFACLEPAPVSEPPLGACLSVAPIPETEPVPPPEPPLSVCLSPVEPPVPVDPPAQPPDEVPLHPCLSEVPPAREEDPFKVCLSPPHPPKRDEGDQGTLRPPAPAADRAQALASALERLPPDLAARVRNVRGA